MKYEIKNKRIIATAETEADNNTLFNLIQTTKKETIHKKRKKTSKQLFYKFYKDDPILQNIKNLNIEEKHFIAGIDWKRNSPPTATLHNFGKKIHQKYTTKKTLNGWTVQRIK